mgnify:CR=1 FL=1
MCSLQTLKWIHFGFELSSLLHTSVDNLKQLLQASTFLLQQYWVASAMDCHHWPARKCLMQCAIQKPVIVHVIQA